MNIKKFNFQQEGLNRYLGSLEAQIMEIIWASKGKQGIKQVHQIIINEQHSYSINTVMTVLMRLWEKGLLERETTGKGRGKHTFFYAAYSKEQFLAEQTKNVTQGLINDYGDQAVCYMVDAMEEADPALLKVLEQKLNELKNKKKP